MSKVLLGDVAHEHKETCKGSKDGYPIVGLEHLIPEEITLTTWDEGSENTFTKMFRKGNVLFGRRRAYLKKAAVAPFNGICSGDITVIEADPDKILPELLPFIIQNDDLFDFAVGKSAGSLSPRVKWEHLKNYEFELPDMDKQKELAELLWAIDDTKKSYQELIAATDELVKSQFIDMFAGTPKGKLEDVAVITMGQSPSGKSYNENGKGTPFYQGKTEFGDLYIGDAVTWTTEPTRFADANDVLMSVRAPVGSTNIATQRCCLGRGLAGLRPIPGKSTTMFILYSMRSIEEEIDNMGVGSTFKAINKKQVHELPIPLADIQLQDRFVELAEQSDKSKFEMEQALSELTATYKRIITENLG